MTEVLGARARYGIKRELHFLGGLNALILKGAAELRYIIQYSFNMLGKDEDVSQKVRGQ